EKSAVPQLVAELPRPIVVTAGRLVLWKRIDGIIDAVAHLRTENTKKNNSGVVSLVVVGDGPECARLSTHAKEVLGNDYLFTGALSHAELLAVIQSADVFVLNSSYEGLSHTLIEALACASPIIATRVGGNEEVLDGYSGAIFVSGHDESELSDALGSMILEKNMRSRLQTEASHVAKRFSPEAMSDTTISALSKLL
ncbi:MAG TPA: glycosyltransferase, partial [Candidatus Kaiserbacteria bacterium]|nr:glycosyltransferase [Candidatus Kaiserbacteria bacterium]